MKDIKITKKKYVEKVETQTESISFHNEHKISETNRKYLPKVLGFFAATSLVFYVGLVSSTVYFAVKEQKVIFAMDNLPVVTSLNENKYYALESNGKNKISYINRTQSSSVSLK
jgi:hypothetical protein